MKRAGVPRETRNRGWTRERVLEALRAYYDEHGEAPVSHKNDGPPRSAARRLFGSWHKALEAAGLPTRQSGTRRPDWTRARIVRAFQTFAEQHGRPPMPSDAGRHGLPFCDGFFLHFDYWNQALEAAGMPPSRSRSPKELPRPFEPRPIALELVPSAADLARIARIVAVKTDASDADADDAVQEAWIRFAQYGANEVHGLDSVLGIICWQAKREVGRMRAERLRHERITSVLSLDAMSEHGDGGMPFTDRLVEQVDARLQLAEFLETRRLSALGDDVLHAVADPQREALNLYEPVAQRRDADVLNGLPAGRWLDKLRDAHAAGRIPCVCWEHVREAGITPPPELAHRFPDCMGERPGRLKRRPGPRPMSKVVGAFLGELDTRTTSQRDVAVA
jgi:hypothetical protein